MRLAEVEYLYLQGDFNSRLENLVIYKGWIPTNASRFEAWRSGPRQCFDYGDSVVYHHHANKLWFSNCFLPFVCLGPFGLVRQGLSASPLCETLARFIVLPLASIAEPCLLPHK